MPSHPRPRIAILGAGFSGAATAIHLSRLSPAPLDLILVDPREPGPGLAHSAAHPDHRLNGPDSLHVVYPDEQEHFGAWLRSSGALERDPEAIAPSGLLFARRGDFGRYLAAEVLAHARSNPSGSRLDHHKGRAQRIVPSRGGFEVHTDAGGPRQVDACVVATGWNAPGTPRGLEGIAGDPAWIGDPWDLPRLERIQADARVILVGMGLTAWDVVAALQRQGHRGPLLALSRRGLRPALQNPARAPGPFWQRLEDPCPPFIARHGMPSTLRHALRDLRADIARATSENRPWQPLFDEMRDSVPLFWPRLAGAERLRYTRHLKTWYDAHRFRSPPQTEDIVARAAAKGQLSFASGQLRAWAPAPGGVQVELIGRNGASRVERAGVIVNCTGPRPLPSNSSNALLEHLVRDGLGRDSVAGIGLEVDAACRLVDRDGRPREHLFAVGPVTAGTFGEISAAPFITRQVLRIFVPELLRQMKTPRGLARSGRF